MKIFLSGLVLMLTLGACAASQPAAELIDAQQAQQILQQQNVQVLDIRTPAEFADGHLAKARNLDFYASDFAEQLKQLDPKAPYVMYCASGRRSAEAHLQMKAMGFEQVYEIQGGYQAWQSQNLPVQKP
jgi:rhodanese-related sulfurtransferase